MDEHSATLLGRAELVRTCVQHLVWCIADGSMLALAARGTKVPSGFGTLHMETNYLYCNADVELPRAGPEADSLCSMQPVQLLCRALRWAPAGYRRFELMLQHANQPLKVAGGVITNHLWNEWDQASHGSTDYGSLTELAAAMQPFAAAEELAVHVSSDLQSVLIRRVGDAMPADAANAL